MTKLLSDHGHQTEVFVPTESEASVFSYGSTRVERVPIGSNGAFAAGFRHAARLLGLSTPLSCYLRSRAVAAAVERRHQQLPFDVVQSSDYLAMGLCLREKTNRVHLVRCSTAADLYNQADGCYSREAIWREKLERVVLRRSSRAYAPSALIANHFRTKHNIPVTVLRPPAANDLIASEPPCGLPERFLIYFGQFRRRKGTHWLSQSLRRACEIDPTIRMVWVGRDFDNDIELVLKTLNGHGAKVQFRHPLLRAELLAVLQRAEAAVIPSLIDNLPNTAIESLMLGVPVIGTRGASIDELVEDGVTGELVAQDDIEGLASAMVRVWQGLSKVKKGFVWQGPVVEEMKPARALQGFLDLTRASTNGVKEVTV